MTLHKEGFKHIMLAVALIFAVLLAFRLVFSEIAWWHYVFYALVTLLFLWVVWFFRSPKRTVLKDDSVILCPADGKVIEIKEVYHDSISGKPVKQVSIFMSPLNVHLNRYPVSGEIVSCQHYPGRYFVAWHPKSSPLNERSFIIIRTPDEVLIGISQIAGFLARRIVCYAEQGLKVEQGAELGFIKFGSRVDLFLPAEYSLNVKTGDTVKGGLSIIARS